MMELWEHPDARIDGLVIMASREEVEAGDISPTLARLQKLLNPEVAEKLKGNLVFGIAGYDDDPRDLFEIPEVRTWMRMLDLEFPYWFYFMYLGPRSTLSFVTFSLCSYNKVPGGNMIDNQDLQAFLTTHFTAMNRVAIAFGETKQEVDDRSHAISEFFFPKNKDEMPDDRFPLDADDLDFIKRGVGQLFREQLFKMNPTEIRSTAALLLGIDRLPSITPGLDLRLDISQANTDGNYGWVDITFTEEEFRLGQGEHFYDPKVGGDTETHTMFEAVAGTDHNSGNIADWLEHAKARCQDGSVRVEYDNTDYDTLDWPEREY